MTMASKSKEAKKRDEWRLAFCRAMLPGAMPQEGFVTVDPGDVAGYSVWRHVPTDDDPFRFRCVASGYLLEGWDVPLLETAFNQIVSSLNVGRVTLVVEDQYVAMGPKARGGIASSMSIVEKRMCWEVMARRRYWRVLRSSHPAGKTRCSVSPATAEL